MGESQSGFPLREDTTRKMIILALAGYRSTDGSFNNRSNNTNFWSASQNSATNAWNRNLNYNNATVNRNNNTKTNGFSVRCLKN